MPATLCFDTIKTGNGSYKSVVLTRQESHEEFDIRKYGDKIMDVFTVASAGTVGVRVMVEREGQGEGE